MHILNTLPQRLDPGATPTFAGLISASLTAPTTTDLTLTGGSTGASLVLGQGATAANIILTPKGTGNVGIGTASPTNPLEVNGIIYSNKTTATGFYARNTTSGAASTLELQSTGTGGADWILATGNSAYGGANEDFNVYKNAAGTGSEGSKFTIKASGTVSIPSTTAGAANAGALVVTGGLSAGNNGNASYFGGAVTSTGNITAPDLILGTSGPSAKSSIAARAARQGLVFDGTAKIPFSLAAFETNPATIHFWFNPATFTGNPRLIGASSSIQLLLDAAGAQFYTNGGSVYGSALTAGKMTAVTVVINGNGTALVYTNGVAGASGAITANLSTAIDTIGGLSTGLNVFSGVLSPLIYNRALSAAEVVSLYEAGVPAGADYNILPAGNSFAFTGLSAFTGYSGIAVSSVTSTSFSASGTATNPFGSGVYGSLQVRSVPGMRYRATWSFTPVSGTPPLVGLGLEGNGTWSNTVAASAGSAEFVVSTAANALKLAFITANGNTTSYSVSNITLVPLGLLLAPDAAQSGGGLTWYDTSGNAANITLPATGVSWNVPTSGKAFSLSLASTTAGSAGAGALVVAGGIYAGAASVFGGQTSFGTAFTPLAWGVKAVDVNSVSSGGLGGLVGLYYDGTAKGYAAAESAGVILQAQSNGTVKINTGGTGAVTLGNATGGATFAGAVAINNTTSAAVAAPSTHKVSILIGGVQYYLLASNV